MTEHDAEELLQRKDDDVRVFPPHFFSEVKVRCDRVFEKLRKHVPAQKQQHREIKTRFWIAFLPNFDCFRKHFKERNGEHEPCPKCKQIFEASTVIAVQS